MSTENNPGETPRAPWSDAVDRLDRINPDILAFHHEPDRRARLERESPPATGALGGMPLGVKDLYRVDGLPTTAGSALPAELFAGEESWIVSTLKAAGAVILGKTQMDEFAYCEPPPTRNPRDLRRTPDGSSGGSAAAVAAGICPAALGSQTLHSTIGPAAACGIVGYKPTYGRWAFDGVPTSPSFDTLGFLAPDVDTITRVAAVLPGWEAIRTTERPVLGIPEAWGVRRLHTEGWKAFSRHVDALRAAGFEVRASEVPWNDDVADWSMVIGDLVNAELAEVHRDWFDRYRDRYRPYTADAIERGRAVPPDRVVECEERRRSFVDELADRTDAQDIDCWICPSSGAVAPLLEGSGRDTWMTRFWSFAGWPTVSIPVFDGDGGLPLGVQVVTRGGADEALLRWAADLHAPLRSLDAETSR
jgi:Asp-tRNA(Asn)/Glu-tRNA(Gln) amidotransferase A subunit family amidase